MTDRRPHDDPPPPPLSSGALGAIENLSKTAWFLSKLTWDIKYSLLAVGFGYILRDGQYRLAEMYGRDTKVQLAVATCYRVLDVHTDRNQELWNEICLNNPQQFFDVVDQELNLMKTQGDLSEVECKRAMERLRNELWKRSNELEVEQLERRRTKRRDLHADWRPPPSTWQKVFSREDRVHKKRQSRERRQSLQITPTGPSYARPSMQRTRSGRLIERPLTPHPDFENLIQDQLNQEWTHSDAETLHNPPSRSSSSRQIIRAPVNFTGIPPNRSPALPPTNREPIFGAPPAFSLATAIQQARQEAVESAQPMRFEAKNEFKLRISNMRDLDEPALDPHPSKMDSATFNRVVRRQQRRARGEASDEEEALTGSAEPSLLFRKRAHPRNVAEDRDDVPRRPRKSSRRSR